jgi:unsaturated rhamnogalacturonyl hydrolase
MAQSPILDKYIGQLVSNSTPEAPMWNVEKARSGKPNGWNYIDGCMVKALLSLAEISGKQEYADFAEEFIDYFVSEDGSIRGYDPEAYNLDNVNAGKTLYTLYNLTGKDKYRKAMDLIYGQLQHQPRTREGNFWHKLIYPNQVWLDGLYMSQPFYMQYEIAYNEGRNCSDSFHQFQVVEKIMRDPKNGLYYHGYDASRREPWCDPVTGLSSNFWLRAEGWFAMALVDTWELMPANMSYERDELRRMFNELIDAMLPYQDKESGMWHQVINLPNVAPNYLETSGSAIFAYALLKGVRLGILDEEYVDRGLAAFDGICATQLSEVDGKLQLGNICLVSGLGDGMGNFKFRSGTFDYYMSEPIVQNDAKGVAPLVLAYTEVLRRDKAQQ